MLLQVYRRLRVRFSGSLSTVVVTMSDFFHTVKNSIIQSRFTHYRYYRAFEHSKREDELRLLSRLVISYKSPTTVDNEPEKTNYCFGLSFTGGLFKLAHSLLKK